VLGAAGGIGQPLSLLLKDLDSVTELCVAATVRAPRGARGAPSREAWRPAAPASPDPQHPLTPLSTLLPAAALLAQAPL